MNTFDKYLREDLPKTDTTSKMKYNSFDIKLGLFFVHTFTFVTLLLEKACKFCRAKLQNKPNKNIGDEHGSFVGCFEVVLNHLAQVSMMKMSKWS